MTIPNVSLNDSVKVQNNLAVAAERLEELLLVADKDLAHLVADPVRFIHGELRAHQRKIGCRDDPGLLAFSYTAPISALIHLCDREPEKTDDALARIGEFARHFIRTYGENA